MAKNTGRDYRTGSVTDRVQIIDPEANNCYLKF